MNEKLSFIGMPNILTMPIKNRIDMLSTGIRSPIGIKIFGSDVKTIEKLGRQVEQSLKDLPGTRTVSLYVVFIGASHLPGYFLSLERKRNIKTSTGDHMKSHIFTVAFILSSQASFAKEPTQEIQLKVTSDGFEPSEIKVKPGTHLILKVTRTTDQTCATQIKVTEMTVVLMIHTELRSTVFPWTLRPARLFFRTEMKNTYVRLQKHF